MELSVIEVASKRDLYRFIRFPDQLYKGCEYYIPALHNNQFKTLSKTKNPAFEHCQARYWMVCEGKRVVGRVAAIINHRYNKIKGSDYMRFGWLDFIENDRVLNMLLNLVEDWAKANNIQYVHGPLGFTSFDQSGVLVDGFNEYPTAWGHYNYPYYGPMIMKYHYKKDVDWIEQRITVPDETNQREIKIAQLVKKRFELHQSVMKSRQDVSVYAGRVFELINRSYEGLYAFSPLTDHQIRDLQKTFMQMIHPDYVSVVLNKEEEVVAFGIVLPSLSHALKKARGRMFPFGFIHILRALHYNDTVDMLLVGVKHEYQNKGAYALVFEKIFGTIKKKGIRYVETTRELENNEKVQQLWAAYEKRQHKRARCYIKSMQ